MFSCAVIELRRTYVEIKYETPAQCRDHADCAVVQHNSYFFSRYYCTKSNIKCPKIGKNTLIIDTFSPVYMGFLVLSISRAILSIALLYVPSHCTLDISAPILVLSLMVAEDGTACHNQQPTLPINVEIV